METVRVTKVDDRLVASKSATGPRRDRLRAEARVLQELAHPGLVQFVGLHETGTESIMHTAFVGTDTWATRPITDPLERAAGVAAVAATLAEIHARGVAHGALRSEHVIHGDDDRPRLCGLSTSRVADAEGRRADLAGLAHLVDEPDLGGGAAGRALAALGERMRAGECEATEVVTAANRIAAGSQPRRRPARGRIRLGSALAGGGAVAVVVAIAVFAATDRGIESAPERPAPNPGSGPAAAEPPDHPTTVEHGGRLYQLGEPGDVAVVGDWDCDGLPTPAILRPDTGEVAMFERWPDPGRTLTATEPRTVPGAVDLSVGVAGAGCDRLGVRTPAGVEQLRMDRR